MTGSCHVCGRAVEVSSRDNTLARHFDTVTPTGRRQLCLGAGMSYRPPLSKLKRRKLA